MLADVYLWLDDAQFSKGSHTNRIQIKHDGTIKWMSIPLVGKGAFTAIRDLVAAEDFRAKHIAFLRQAFASAPFAAEALAIVEEVYAEDDLCRLLIKSAEVPARHLGLPAVERRDVTSGMGVGGQSWQRVLDLVREVGGTHYITGHGAARYMDHEAFDRAGVEIEYIDYSKTAWPQAGTPFTPFVSILDLIANTGERARDHLHPATIGWREFLARAA